MGIKAFLTKPAIATVTPESIGLASDYASTFFLILTNPLTILFFAAVFASLGLGSVSGNYNGALMLILGVFLGSAGWWLLLSSGVKKLPTKLMLKNMVWVSRTSGAVVSGFGIIALLWK